MGGLAHAHMAERAARKAASKRREPYASMPCALLASAPVRGLTPVALAVYLGLQSNWHPGSTHDKLGSAILPIREAAKLARCNRGTATAAFHELQEAGLIRLLQPAIRPGQAGSEGPGKAASWRVLHREPECRMPPLPHGVSRPQGSVRINVGRIRSDLPKLTGCALIVLVHLLGRAGRDKHGGLLVPDAMPVVVADVAAALGVGEAAVRRALVLLCEKGALVRVNKPAGHRSGTYSFAAAYQRREKRLESEKPCPLATPYAEGRALSRRSKPQTVVRGHVEAVRKSRRASREGTLVETMMQGASPIERDFMVLTPAPLPAAVRHRDRGVVTSPSPRRLQR